jgi:hypothetical protein
LVAAVRDEALVPGEQDARRVDVAPDVVDEIVDPGRSAA